MFARLALLCAVAIVTVHGTSGADNTFAAPNTDAKNVANDTSSSGDSFESCFGDKITANDATLSASAVDHSAQLMRGSHKFSFDLLKFLSTFESKDTSPGLIISPFSVWSALIATYMGSRGDTEAEIRQALSIDEIPKQAVGMSYQGLKFWYELKKNATINKKYSYSAANRIYVNRKLPLNQCIMEHFENEIVELDFSDAARAANQINSWIDELTRGMIKELVSPNGLSPWTQIVIANAVYFQSQWLYKFDTAKSERKSFQVTPSESNCNAHQ